MDKYRKIKNRKSADITVKDGLVKKPPTSSKILNMINKAEIIKSLFARFNVRNTGQ